MEKGVTIAKMAGRIKQLIRRKKRIQEVANNSSLRGDRVDSLAMQ